MKKFFINGFLFLASTVVFYTVAVMLWGSYLPADMKKNINYRRGSFGFTYTRLQEVNQTGKVDVLFVGSSHAYCGFDARIFGQHGYTSFNLGSSMQTPVQTDLLLNRYLDRLSPSVVVYEIYPYAFASDGVESAVDIIANDRINGGDVSMAATVNSVKTYNTLLYGFVSRLFRKEKPIQEQLSITASSGNIISHSKYIRGGFMEKSMELADSSAHTGFEIITPAVERKMQADAAAVQTKDGKWYARSYQLAAFENTLRKMKERNIRVILVQAPVVPAYYALLRCSNEINAYFSSKAEYYNFNEGSSFDEKVDFADYHHLNQTGVTKMNEVLIQKAFSKK